MLCYHEFVCPNTTSPLIQDRYSIDLDPKQIFWFQPNLVLQSHPSSSSFSELETTLSAEQSGCDCQLSIPVRYLRIQVESNYGNGDYTCLYNVGAYGVPRRYLNQDRL